MQYPILVRSEAKFALLEKSPSVPEFESDGREIR